MATGLLDDLVSFWLLDEASGDRADSIGSNTLTDVNTVVRGAGKIQGAADFVAASSERLEIADNISLSTGDISFTTACWVNFDLVTLTRRIMGKWTPTGNQREYIVDFNATANRIRFTVSNDGTATATVNADGLGAPSTGVWYFVCCWHDADTNTINIQINDRRVDTLAHSTGVFDSTAKFALGCDGDNANFFDGKMDLVGFWKRVLTKDERMQLYNNGRGTEPPFTFPDGSAITTSLESFWKMNEVSGNALDSHGSNELTDTNTVGSTTAGIVDRARDFDNTASEHFTLADNTSLSMGDIDFTIGCWVNLDTISVNHGLVTKASVAGLSREYALWYRGTTNRFRFEVSQDGVLGTSIEANSHGTGAVGVWVFVLAWHNATDNTINIQVNNGVIDSVAHTTGVFDGTANFRIGVFDSSGVDVFLNGKMDNVAVWKRLLTQEEKTLLYNNGNSCTHPFTITTITKTIKPGGGGDFTTLALWEAAQRGNAAGRRTIERALCFVGEIGVHTFGTWINDTEGYPHIEVDQSAKHRGIYTLSGTVTITGGTAWLASIPSYARLIGLIFNNASLTGLSVPTTSVRVVFDKCIFNAFGTIASISGTAQFRNCIAHDAASATGIIVANAVGFAEVYNCTIQCNSASNGCLNVQNSGVITEQNNYLHGTGNSIYVTTLGTINKGANTATSNTEALTVALRDIAFSTTTFKNVTGGSENLHIKINSALRATGEDLSLFGVTEDIDGTTRLGNRFDIGADQVTGRSQLLLFT